jgi:methionyl-tRNA synthetase
VSRFYLTTAIDYVNGAPHMGHAYEKITADVIARYLRLSGRETRFVIGNDEHSQNVYKRARDLGLDPLAYCDQMEQVFRGAYAKLEISYDDFIRTTQPRHRVAVQAMASRIAEGGDIYEGYYEGWYCVSCEAFKQEKDLVDGNCPIHKTKPEWIREKNHFFRLSAYRDRLLAHFHAHPRFLQPDVRRNEMLRVLEGGLEDISVSRAGQAWGIPLPANPSSVVYVWFDALINYASAVGYGDPEQQALYDAWWPANLHVIGKDITRFHSIVWPAMLMSAGAPVPERVFGHGFITYGGEKMSKSLGTVVDPLEAVEAISQRGGERGLDALRLFLVKEIAYGADGDFTWERFYERYNADLANNFGNLVSRIASMAERYRGGRLTSTGAPGRLASVASEAVTAYRTAMERFALQDGAAAAFALITAANEFIAETEPWALAKQPEQADRLGQVLFDVAEAVRIAAVLLLPVLPASAAEILRRVGETRAAPALRLDADARWRADGERRLAKADALWPRLVDTPASGPQVAASSTPIVSSSPKSDMSDTPQTPTPQPPAPQPQADGDPTPVAATPAASAPIVAPTAATPAAPATAADTRLSIDEFMKIDLRVAKVLTAERVPKSKKLMKLSVDVGSEQRTIVAGIAEAYEPDALVGRSIVIVANLKPATLMGVESNGMVLAGSPEGGKPELVAFVNAPPPGSRVR